MEQGRVGDGIENVALRADQTLIEERIGPAGLRVQSQAPGPAMEGRLQRIGYALHGDLAGLDAIDEDPDFLRLIDFGKRPLIEPGRDAVDEQPDEAFFPERFEPGLEILLGVGSERKGDAEPGARRQGLQMPNHVGSRLGFDLAAALQAANGAEASQKDAEVIEDFRDGADRGPLAQRQLRTATAGGRSPIQSASG